MDVPQYELERLRAAVTGRDRGSLTLEPASPEEEATIDELVARRGRGEPLQYLEGTVQFGPLELAIDRRALIPRPETERVWEEAVRSLGEAGPGTVIVDLGTGSGALALGLKHAFPAAQVFGVDISGHALELAGENSARTGLDVTWIQGDLFSALPAALMGRVDLVVSNPPYVSEAEYGRLPVEIKDHEPRQALVAGPMGTEVLERIAGDGYWWVGIGGWVLCEIGADQGRDAERIFSSFDREVRLDLAGRDRILVARKGAPCC